MPPTLSARLDADFGPVSLSDHADLAAAMGLNTGDLIADRLQGGRRCFCLKLGGRVVSYGWVTRGPERVGELERTFNLKPSEAYIWDCGTVEDMRGQGLYSDLLNRTAAWLAEESFERIWIGASQRNVPSVKGIQNAGFWQVIDLTYRRFLLFTLLRFYRQGPVSRDTLAAAYRILLRPSELRIANFAVGMKRFGMNR